MKKIILMLTLCIVLIAMTATIGSADEGVLESPGVKIIIDGKIGTYDDVPIIVNGRTLLPFRAVLVNLGVQNDEQHIAWNPDDNSVTILKEIDGVSKKVYLQLGNSTALVNGVEETLDVAPILYNDRTYIPARFIAQALGKKVVWDGSFNAVLIRDETDFNEIKDILDKSNAAMETVKNYKISGAMDIEMSMGDMGNMATKAQYTGEMDYANKVIHMNIGMDMDLSSIKDIPAAQQKMTTNMEAYYTTDAYYMYMKNPDPSVIESPVMNQWIKTSFPDGMGDIMFENNDNLKMFKDLNVNDAICAGMVVDEAATDDKTIVLKGDVYLKDILDSALQMQSNLQLEQASFDIGKTYIEMYIDKNTYFVTKSKAIMDMSLSVENQTMQYNINADYDYSDYNGDFTVVLPEEVNKAIDMQSLIDSTIE